MRGGEHENKLLYEAPGIIRFGNRTNLYSQSSLLGSLSYPEVLVEI